MSNDADVKISGLDEADQELSYPEWVYIKCREGTVLKLPARCAVKLCTMIKNALTSQDQIHNETEPISMDGWSEQTIRQVWTYLEHCMVHPPSEIPKPLPSEVLSQFVSQWEFQIVDKSIDEVFRLMTLANYLGCLPLLNLTCARIASLIKNKTPDAIRQNLGLVVPNAPSSGPVETKSN